MTASGGQPSQNVIFFAEQAAEGMSQLDDIRNDLVIILPQLRILRNNTPTTIKGGGSPVVRCSRASLFVRECNDKLMRRVNAFQ